MTERYQVVLFLELMKRTAEKRFLFAPRKKNLDSLARLGITREHAKSLVLALRPDQYVSGPSPDKNDPTREVWVFGICVGEDEVYVKLCVTVSPDRCVCIPFHIAERPLHYPLRES